MKTKIEYSFGKLSSQGYRHYPFLYLAHGRDGFTLAVLGIIITIKF